MSIGRQHLELSVNLASRIMSLPAVPTCTWCDIAAESLTAAFERCVVLVWFESPHALGWDPVGIAYKPESAAIVDTLRRAFASGRPAGTPESQVSGETRCATRRLGAPRNGESDTLDALLVNLGGQAIFWNVIRLNESKTIDLIVECVKLGDETEWLDEGFQEALRATIGLIAHRARLAAVPLNTRSIDPLNLREVKVLDALTHGKTIAEIAGEMNRSTHTVRDYLKSMHKKIGASSRAELIARATGRM